MEPQVLVEAKAWYESKTMLISIATVIIGIVVTFLPMITDQKEVLGLSDQAVSIIGLVASFLGLVNGALRAVTSQPLASSGNIAKPVPAASPRAISAYRNESHGDIDA